MLVLETAAWPLAILVCPPRFDESWVAELDAGFAAVFARRERFALITDTHLIQSLPGAKERRALATWASRPDLLRLQKELNVGSATIVPNALMRGSLQALYWLWTPPAPQHAARDLDDAWAWCTERLSAHGLAPPRHVDRGALARAARDAARGAT